MNAKRWIVLWASCVVLCGTGWGAPATNATDRSAEPGKQFVYKQSAGAPQELEVYYPPDWKPGGPKVPGLLLFHGGGWTGGDLSQFRYACAYFASRGLVAATANYRMLRKDEVQKRPAGEGSHKRVCVTDAKSAVRWMKQHADELNMDPQRLIVGGGSAGGHIAVLATTNPGLSDPSDPQGFDTAVVAYLLFNPAFTAKDSGDPEVDVLKHLTASLPPAILFFGTRDNWKAGSDAALLRLKTLGNTTAELWTAEDEAHGFYRQPPWQGLTLAAADRFLAAHGFLKGDCPLAAPANGKTLVKVP